MKDKLITDDYNLITVDYGDRLWHIIRNGDPASYRTMETDEFKQLEFCGPGDKLVGEAAHFTPRKEGSLNISLSQPLQRYEADELMAMCLEKGAEIRLFPQKETPKWKKTLGGEKDDAQDALRLYEAVKFIGFDRLQKFSTLLKPTSNLEKAGREVKSESNMILNYTRSLKDLQATTCTKLLEDNLEAIYNAVNNVNPGAADAFFDVKEGPQIGVRYSITSAGIGLWTTVVASDGSVRRYNDQLWGMNSLLRHALNFRPMHHNGGVARSNLWFHNFGKRKRRRAFNSVKYVGQDKLLRDQDSLEIRDMKREYRRECIDTLRAMQQIALTLE